MTSQPSVDVEIRSLYQSLLESWNEQDAIKFASHFTTNGSIVGFDGTPINDQSEIQAHLAGIFADHRTATYVAIVQEVRLLAPSVALLRSAVGMIPPSKADLNPALNAIQSLVAVKQGQGWLVVLFHNTPAAFHGRPEAVEAMAQELRKLL